MAIGRTCSDEFARSLADALDMRHECDDPGSFTDTANLAGIVRECTNVSVGYDFEHSNEETLDADYLERLCKACVQAFGVFDVRLDISRECGAFHDWRDDTANNASAILDMSDADIEDMVWGMDTNELTDLVIGLRDELERESFKSWDWPAPRAKKRKFLSSVHLDDKRTSETKEDARTLADSFFADTKENT
jgi:hypothetical protein